MPRQWALTITTTFAVVTAKKIMSITHVGKIGRLYKSTRDELGQCIENGQQGKQLVKWLNGLPDVKEILKEHFGGRPITEQNLSEWKQTGHSEWLRHQETRGFIQHLHEQAGELKSYDEDDEWYTEVDTSEDLAMVLAAELARVTEALLKTTDDPKERMRLLREALHELAPLRRHNHRAARLQRDQLVWQREEDERDKRAERDALRKQKHKIFEPVWAQMEANGLAKCFGGGENGMKLAEMIAEMQHDLPPGTLTGQNQSKPVQPNPT